MEKKSTAIALAMRAKNQTKDEIVAKLVIQNGYYCIQEYGSIKT